MAKTKKGKPNEKQSKTNINDVFIRLIDAIYDVINSGNIIGIIVVIFFVIIYKLPAENVNEHIKSVINLFTTEKYYIIPLSITLVVSVTVNIYQKKIYQTEIKRLSEIRKFLMHGLENKTLKVLEEHHPSDYKIDEQ